MKNHLKQNIDSESVMIDGLKKLLFCQLIQIKEECGLDNKLYELAKQFFFLVFEDNMVPKRITDLHEEGYAFCFLKKDNDDIEIWFEIYDDCEFGYIAFDKTQNYKMIANVLALM